MPTTIRAHTEVAVEGRHGVRGVLPVTHRRRRVSPELPAPSLRQPASRHRQLPAYAVGLGEVGGGEAKVVEVWIHFAVGGAVRVGRVP